MRVTGRTGEMTIAFEEGFFRTTLNKFILEANLPSMKGVVETWEGMAKEVGHQVSRNEGWPSNGQVRVHLATKIIPILCARILLCSPSDSLYFPPDKCYTCSIIGLKLRPTRLRWRLRSNCARTIMLKQEEGKKQEEKEEKK